MKCPYCGDELKQGYIKSSRRIYWSKEKKLGFFSNCNDVEVNEPNTWNGCFAEASYCPACKKCIVTVTGSH